MHTPDTDGYQELPGPSSTYQDLPCGFRNLAAMNRFSEVQQRLAIREFIPDRHTNPISFKMEGRAGSHQPRPVQARNRRANLLPILCASSLPRRLSRNYAVEQEITERTEVRRKA